MTLEELQGLCEYVPDNICYCDCDSDCTPCRERSAAVEAAFPKLVAVARAAEDVVDTTSDCSNADGTEYCGRCPLCRLSAALAALTKE